MDHVPADSIYEINRAGMDAIRCIELLVRNMNHYPIQVREEIRTLHLAINNAMATLPEKGARRFHSA